MSPEQPPETRLETAAFSFQRFIVRKAVFDEIQGVTPDPQDRSGTPFSGPVTFNISRRIDRDPLRGVVTVNVVIEPDPSRQPYKLEVTVSGVFASDTASIELFDLFCKTTVPIILFPYIRHIVHMLTADAAYGPIRLHPINLGPALAGMEEKRRDLSDDASAPT